ncbi:MAG TPA: bifunctional diaminohydroxyphosphoribosylaminopyrimidine deaminase/5-amino-6-(5-phosphoribosylamino)uracil reductase RibD [Verrucomicrobiae bacterium]|nr:bifunctional diaminohydroxyphosphoribosylaminopyrimidine deaminase/5-amino-6-(5-phosphoribosylamino)uracil reductase RibD [Verrucomicrobiae bacterium]
MSADLAYMRQALRLARRGYGATSPNPIVGAVLVKGPRVLGQGWHHRAGEPHAEIEALQDAHSRGLPVRGATLYVTLEPCSTYGRTPPCTEAIVRAGLRRVVFGATDPNPCHCGRAAALLEREGIRVTGGVLAQACAELNEAFNHWIVHRTPLVTVKAAMTLDGKIATSRGESKWITGASARAVAMKLRQGADGILVGINTVIQDNPWLTVRAGSPSARTKQNKPLRRFILDSQARTPLGARVVSDSHAVLTTIFVGPRAPRARVAALEKRVRVVRAPEAREGWLDLGWVLRLLGKEEVLALLVEGGGEVNASFLLGGLAQRIAFFYAPMVVGGQSARRAVAGEGARNVQETLELENLRWRAIGNDWLLTANIGQGLGTAQARRMNRRD